MWFLSGGRIKNVLNLFLGQVFLCLEGERCWHPLWTAILLVHTASSTFYQHSLIIFDFLFYHQIETALSTDNFCFCDHQPFMVILKCAHNTEWSASSSRAAPSGKDYFPYLFFRNIYPLQSFDLTGHYCYVTINCISIIYIKKFTRLWYLRWYGTNKCKWHFISWSCSL